MRLPLDLSLRSTWIAAGAFFGVAIPLIVFLSGDELLLTIIATLMGGAVGFALWTAAQRGTGRG